MKIGTYNVLGLTGYPKEEGRAAIGVPGAESNCDHFARVFSELDCDILALQEGVALSAMQRIAGEMKCYLATFPSPLHWPGHVLSRYPILESRVLSHADPSEQTPTFSRTFGAALLSISGTPLWVVDVHLHPSDAELRIREAKEFGRHFESLLSVSDRLVVLGDFNSEVDEKIHRDLKALEFANAMETAGGGIQATMDTAGIPEHFIDHIYLSPALATTLVRAEVVRGNGFRHDGPQTAGMWAHSDHLPVVAHLDWSD